MVSGKRLNYYHNQAVSKNSKPINDEAYPIDVAFNLYFNSFVILTKIDVRVYSAQTGHMKKVFTDLQDDKNQSDINCICFGARQRKFFIADNSGLIRQYNMKNGEYLRKVNTLNEIEHSEFASKLTNVKKNESIEVTQILFLMEEKILISASLDSLIRIYDESDPEDSVLIKVLCGGNQGSEISCIRYSSFFTSLAVGSMNGIISLWEFENGKLENVYFGPKSEVVQIEFVEPLPILISAYT